ncbi:MAG: hypothetical protein A2X08_04975 [Bacteroidetes bacterium GWA2_32_17]|nr:MAG: hypothetical protein A2X08_04975 [Bacteroidetes bacterium GWA2_32_17]
MFTDFSAWWDALLTVQKVYWMIAVPFTLIFVLQLIFSLIVGDTDHDASGNIDSAIDSDQGMPFQFFTLKNMTAFFTILGWSGIACVNAGLGNVLIVLISVLCGLIMMVIMSSIFYFMSKLVETGNLDIKNAINKTGSVYIPIPASRKGQGKIQVKVQSALRELDAITDETENIKTGTIVIVTEVIDNNILVVKNYK